MVRLRTCLVHMQHIRYGSPTANLAAILLLDQVLAKDNRGCMKKLTHLHAWQLFMLADRLWPLIKRPRKNDGEKVGPTTEHDHLHRLFFLPQVA